MRLCMTDLLSFSVHTSHHCIRNAAGKNRAIRVHGAVHQFIIIIFTVRNMNRDATMH